jgi:hypothetical protein
MRWRRLCLAFAEVVANNDAFAPRAPLVDCKTCIDQALALDPDDGRIQWLLAPIWDGSRKRGR